MFLALFLFPIVFWSRPGHRKFQVQFWDITRGLQKEFEKHDLELELGPGNDFAHVSDHFQHFSKFDFFWKSEVWNQISDWSEIRFFGQKCQILKNVGNGLKHVLNRSRTRNPTLSLVFSTFSVSIVFWSQDFKISSQVLR